MIEIKHEGYALVWAHHRCKHSAADWVEGFELWADLDPPVYFLLHMDEKVCARHVRFCPACGADLHKELDATQSSRLQTACGDSCSRQGGCKCVNNGVEYPLDSALARRLKIDRSRIQHGIYWLLMNYGPTRYSWIRQRMPGRGYFALDSALRTMRMKGLIESKGGAWCAIGVEAYEANERAQAS